MNDSKFNNDKRTLYIDEINVFGVNKWKFRVKMRILDGDTDENVNLATHGSRWTPSRSCEVPVSGFIQISLKAGVSLGGIGLGKQETTTDIIGSRISEEFLKRRGRAVAEGSPNPADSRFSVSEYVTFGDHSVTIMLKLHPSHASETMLQALIRLEAAMSDYNQSKLNRNDQPIAAFTVGRVTSDLLKDQQKYDYRVSDLNDKIKKILSPFEDAEKIGYSDGVMLEKEVDQIISLIVDTGKFVYQYIQRQFINRLDGWTIPMVDRRRFEELHDRAIELETLKRTRKMDMKPLLELPTEKTSVSLQDQSNNVGGPVIKPTREIDVKLLLEPPMDKTTFEDLQDQSNDIGGPVDRAIEIETPKPTREADMQPVLEPPAIRKRFKELPDQSDDIGPVDREIKIETLNIARETDMKLPPEPLTEHRAIKIERHEVTRKIDHQAIEIEALKATKEIDMKLLNERLQPVSAEYDPKHGCMEGTRQGTISRIISWTLESVGVGSSQGQSTTRNLLWLYGMSGTGKTSVANSICSHFHAQEKLGGSFFCRHDDSKLSNPDYVLSTLMCQLAETWSPFRKVLAEELRKDPKITPKSATADLLLKLLRPLRNYPPYPLVLVIDSLDECGDNSVPESMLREIFQLTWRISWLKIIITSRQWGVIGSFFDRSNRSGFGHLYAFENLTTDNQTREDIRRFAEQQFSAFANAKYLVDDVVTRANGLFIVAEILCRLSKDKPNPQRYIAEILDGSPVDALGNLHKLYSSILESCVREDKAEYHTMMGTILAVASYRPLCAQTIAMLVGHQVATVETWVDSMSPLLYQDDQKNGAIRARNISITDFLTSSSCPEEIRVDIQQSHKKMALSCLDTMTWNLKFNICGLRNSFLSNEEVEDMKSRVKENISDELQYSCIHWSSHVALSGNPAHPAILAKLSEFFKDGRPLYWIETLSVMGMIPIGSSMLQHVLQWAKGSSIPALEYVDDTLRFLVAFQTPIATSAPHVYVSGLPFTPTGSLLWKESGKLFNGLIQVQQGRMKTWPIPSTPFEGPTTTISSVSYSPDGLHIVSDSWDEYRRTYDVETGALTSEPLKSHTRPVSSVAYSPDGHYVVFGSDNDTIRLKNVKTGALVFVSPTMHSGGVTSVAYSPDGQNVASGSWDKTLRIWNAKTGAPVGGPLKGHTGYITSVAYSPDSRYIASGSDDNTIRIWDAETEALVVGPLKGHTDYVTSVAYSPDGRHIVSGSCDCTIRIWNVEKPAYLAPTNILPGRDGWWCR
ncbi:hypothetical protein FRC20_004461 [Serendipita sp. 405]|nr:hypothetical protein FRC20_004461 [Serendipita sp. 405]